MESKINDGRREVFDKSGETMGMKDGENAVWKRI